MESQQGVRVRCQRIGCNATFTDDDNPEDSCQYHDSPLFHDGMKEWSCCKKKSHDFSLFLEIPGCKRGKHTTEKPVLATPKASPRIPVSSSVLTPKTDASSKESCSRCRQGFFCSDHGSQPRKLNSEHISVATIPPAETSPDVKGSQPRKLNSQPTSVATTPPAETSPDVNAVSAPAKKIIDINQPQVCKNKGCDKTFKEKDNHDTACSYHPGPAIFHDRKKGWQCCDIHVSEFDEFMSIPPCTKGWHNADPTP